MMMIVMMDYIKFLFPCRQKSLAAKQGQWCRSADSQDFNMNCYEAVTWPGAFISNFSTDFKKASLVCDVLL